jgi:hypothetical protein
VLHSGNYGDLHSAEVYYTLGSNRLLVHELSHVQGCVDRGPFASKGDYSPIQKEIMQKENVNNWIETNYYKNEDKKYHEKND